LRTIYEDTVIRREGHLRAQIQMRASLESETISL
jgi:hypothetical protein